MPDFLQDLWESIAGLPELIFGERMHDGWGIAFAIYTGCFLFASTIQRIIRVVIYIADLPFFGRTGQTAADLHD